MKAGFPPIDIKFTDRIKYYNAFDEYHEKNNIGAMENLFAGYINDRLTMYLSMLGEEDYNGLVETDNSNLNPALRTKFIDGLNTPLSECVSEDDAEW